MLLHLKTQHPDFNRDVVFNGLIDRVHMKHLYSEWQKVTSAG